MHNVESIVLSKTTLMAWVHYDKRVEYIVDHQCVQLGRKEEKKVHYIDR